MKAGAESGWDRNFLFMQQCGSDGFLCIRNDWVTPERVQEDKGQSLTTVTHIPCRHLQVNCMAEVKWRIFLKMECLCAVSNTESNHYHTAYKQGKQLNIVIKLQIVKCTGKEKSCLNHTPSSCHDSHLETPKL